MPENLLHNLPDPMVKVLLEDELVDQPSGIVDSAEASVALPDSTTEEFDGLMADFERIADDAQEHLERAFPSYYPPQPETSDDV